MTQHRPASEYRFLGDSEMAMLMQTQDWSLTPLGEIAAWSPYFQTALNILFNTSCPMFLVWGHDRILVYNDAYSAVLRENRIVVPLGISLVTDCPLVGSSLFSDVEQVFSTQRSLQRQHQPLPIHRDEDDATPLYTWCYSPLWQGIDQIGGVFATGYNISSQANPSPQTALRREESWVHLITDALPVLIAYVDKHHYYRFNNQTYETWFGLPATTFTNQPVREVLGESAYEAVRPYMEQVLLGQPVSYESEILYQDGNTRYIKADYIPHINANGEVEGYCSLVSDVSDRKRIENDRNQAEAALRASEADFRAMFNVTSVGMAQADVKTRQFLHVNAALCAITGYTEAELLTLTVDDINHPEEREREQDYFANLLHGATSIYQAEKRYLRKDGKVVWVLVTGNVIHDAEGQVSRLVMVIQDMTKRKQSEKALRRSESRFRLVTQAVNGLIFDWNLQTNDVYRSDKLYDLIGVFRKDAPASANWWRERIHPDDMDRLQADVAELFASSNYFYDSEYRVRHEQGHWVDVWEQGCLIRDDQGQVIRIVGCTVDISDRKRAAENLRESERRFRRLVESNMFGVAFGDFQGGVQYANDYFLKMVGYTRTELESRQVRWTEMTPSEFLPLDQQAMMELKTKGIATPFEKEYLRRDGSRVPIMIGSALLQKPYDQQQEIIAFFLDLTKQKQVEAERAQVLHQLETSLGQLEAVINNMSEGLIIADPQGNILTFNPAALTLHDYDSVEEVQKHLHEFPDTIVVHDLQGNLIPLNQWPIARAVQGETLANCEIQVHRCDTGKTFIGSYSATPVWDKQGNLILAIATVRDVTAQRQAQIELARSLAAEQTARTEAEAANRIKDEFLAILSHELRSPLNPILGWARLLQTKRFDQQATLQALQTIERNAKLQAQLIDDLLDVSRILRGKMALNICSIDLVMVIEAALETVRLAAEAKRIQIQTRLTPNASKTLGDAARLQQIVWNLLSNAVKFTPEGGRVEVRLEQGDGGDRGDREVVSSPSSSSSSSSPSPSSLPSLPPSYAQIVISDTGKGISPDFLPYVFDYFRQEDGKITRKFGGLGLGLAIVRHLTELHGGSVYANSAGEGQGATFIVRLPLMPTTTAPEEASFTMPPKLNFSQIQVLVVDDEADMRELMQCILEQQGVQVRIAASAAEALVMFDDQPPDLLISDIGMPDVDGYTLVRQIRQRSPEQGGLVPAIALTAYAGEYDQQQALKAGFQRHVSKPVEPDALVRTIVMLLEPTLSSNP